jgi:hypothetical protein
MRRLRPLLVLLMLAVLAVKGIIPYGFMPDAAAAKEGVYAVTLCTAFGPQIVHLDDAGNKIPDHPMSSKTNGETCPMASPVMAGPPFYPDDVSAVTFARFVILQAKENHMIFAPAFHPGAWPQPPPVIVV